MALQQEKEEEKEEKEEEEEEGLWVSILDELAENILQRLPLSDYIRFAAVCRRWRSIQSDHRLRFSPSPPPLLSLPWFISFDPSINHLTSALCISPWEPLPHRRHLLSLPATFDTKSYTSSSPHGWLLMLDLESSSPPSFHFSLFNPISGSDIPLPPISLPSFSYPAIVSPPPSYTVFNITEDSNLFFVQPDDETWTQVHLPKLPCSAIASNNVLYYMSSDWDFCIVDPGSVQIFEMDKAQIEEAQLQWQDAALVESDGDVLLAVSVSTDDEELCPRKITEFRVFKPDLEKKMWVKVEGLGERVIVMDGCCTVSLKGDGVGNGVKGNCIYFFESSRRREGGTRSQWKVFDLGSGEVKDVENPSWFPHRMFVPSLC